MVNEKINLKGVLLPGAVNLITFNNNSRALKTAISLLGESILYPPLSPDKMSAEIRIQIRTII